MGRQCIRCGSDIGFPNVRLARRANERGPLFIRAVQSRRAGSTSAAQDRLRALARTAGNCTVVMNRRLGTLFSWITGDDPLLHPYHRQVERGRPPGDDDWNAVRESAEAAVLPYCYQEINFAALSPDGRGMDYYGPYLVTLKLDLVAHRTTLFEENPYFFFKHHGVLTGTRPPVGYRARWRERRSIAIAKLGDAARADPTLPIEDLIMGANGDAPSCDFIEAHIYGTIHRDCIQRVEGPLPADPVEREFWRLLQQTLHSRGVEVKQV